MEEPARKRARWRKMRWRVVVAFWLALPILYPLSTGPLIYCWHRGWISSRETPAGLVLAEPFGSLYAPLVAVARRLPMSWQLRWSVYGQWWVRLADRHKNADAKDGIIPTHWTPPKPSEP